MAPGHVLGLPIKWRKQVGLAGNADGFVTRKTGVGLYRNGWFFFFFFFLFLKSPGPETAVYQLVVYSYSNNVRIIIENLPPATTSPRNSSFLVPMPRLTSRCQKTALTHPDASTCSNFWHNSSRRLSNGTAQFALDEWDSRYNHVRGVFIHRIACSPHFYLHNHAGILCVFPFFFPLVLFISFFPFWCCGFFPISVLLFYLFLCWNWSSGAHILKKCISW